MSKYEFYKTEQEMCQELAKVYSDADDFKLTVFYMNAAEGFRQKAEKVHLLDFTK